MAKIFIDAGHNDSGFDTGASGNGMREQDITFAVAQILGALLQGVGVDIKYSRDIKTCNVGYSLNSSLSQRANMANNFGADYFISIHCNSFGVLTANGTEICICGVGGKAEQLANSIRPNLAKLGLQDRGNSIRPELAVLKKTKMSAILIELGFISNPNDAQILRDRQDELANAIFQGVCNKLGIEQKKVVSNKGHNYKKVGETHVVEVDPLLVGGWVTDQRADKIDISNFVNGGYFGWQDDGKTYSCGHLVNDGVILSNCATHGVAVTTLCVFYDGVVQVKPVFDISLECGLKFAISGAGIYPNNTIAKEGFTGKFADVSRATTRTYIGYRKSDNKIIICVRPNTDISRAQETFRSLGVDAGLTLDGGGSSCMRVNGEYKLSTVRQIHNIVMWG